MPRIPDPLAEVCRQTPIFDTHEHLYPVAMLASPDGAVRLADLIRNGYLAWALPPDTAYERDALLRTLPSVKTRFFYFNWIRSMRALYGFEGDLHAGNWDGVSEAVSENYRRPGWRRHVLRERANVRISVLDQFWDTVGTDFDRELFAAALRINSLAFGFHPESRDHNGVSAHELAAKVGMGPLGTFDEYEAFCRRLILTSRKRGVVCLKSALAYDRDLCFAPPDRDAAAKAWGKRPGEVSAEAARSFSDYLVDLVAGLAAEAGLPFQWHTGLGLIGGSRPTHLAGLVGRHPDTLFVLLHGGYPWCSEWTAMAFTYPNVRLDMTWLCSISPAAARRALEEAIDVANPGAICGGGGDTWTVEEVCASLLVLRETVERSLGGMVEEGRLGLEQACASAKGILHDHAAGIYGV